MAKQSGTDLDDVASGGGKRARIDDTITVHKFTPKKWTTLRIFGSIFTYGGYWVTTKNKDGKKAKFYTPCPSYDPATQQRDSTKYDPWRDLEAQQADMERDAKTLNFTKAGFMNAIFRKAQQDAPRKQAKHTKTERKTGFKEKDSDSFTPVVALRLPGGAINKLKEQAGLNVREVKGQTKQFSVTHPKYGCDVRIYYDPDKAPADQYQVSIGKPTKLTEEEEAYLKWDLSDLESAPDAKEVKRDFESWASRNGVKVGGKKKKNDVEDEDFDEDDGDDDDDEPKSKKKSKKDKDAKSKKKSKKDEDEDEDFDEDDGDDSDDDDEDEPKSKKSKKGGKKSKKDDDDEDEDDFDEDDEDSDDEDEDDEPKSKKKAKGKDAKSKKSKKDDDDEDDFDDDEDSDSDDDEDDEDEDEPKGKKSKKSKAKPGKKSKKDDDDEDDFDDEDSDDEDDEDSDDDEDDEPKSKKKVKAKAKSKKKKDEDEDDDFDDEDGDEDEDEDDEDEDEPKSKKSKSKVKSKKKSKR